MEAEHAGLLQDTHFWVLLATIAFAILAYVKGRAPILAFLDARTIRIKAELDEAARLREEAQALLADAEKRHSDAVATSQKIVDAARENAAALEKHAATKIAETHARREAQLVDRLARAETAAITELRAQAADIAAKAAEQLLRDAAGKNGAQFANDAIRDITSKAS